jgi:filamentous hemagglutinin
MRTPSVFERFIARVLLAIVSFQLAFGTQMAAAQTTPATPAPADTRTAVTRSANGTPVVNIATPNSAGVSHNKFNTYDVGTSGLILNNSAANAVSIIGGGTAANANLTGGQAASLILNEVIKPNPGSLLAGYQEILGPSAELVIANPWGVTCNGCGFINTPRVTLTTGMPTLSASGALAGFTITGGQIAIGQKGLDATRQSTLDLLARSVSLAGNVIVGSQSNGISGDLQVLAGANSFDYATRTANGIAGGSATPQFAIDSSMLGGMYADRIRLLVNEHGAGVRLAGGVAALADDLVISADGRIELRGAASAARDFTVNGGDVQVQLADSNTYLYGGRDLNINATGGLEFDTGSIGAARNASFATAGALNDLGGANDQRFSGSNGMLTVDAGGALTLSGGYWTSPQLTFKAQSVHFGAGSVVYGTRATGNAVSLTTPGLLSITGGKIYSNADAALDAARLEVDSAGVVAATGALSTTVARGSAGGIDNAGTLQGDSVNLVAAGDPASTPTTFHNASSGKILANKAMSVGESGANSPAGSTLQNDGTLSGDTVTIDTSTTANTGAIQATTTLDLRSATLQNIGAGANIIGSTSASGTASIRSDTIVNGGTIWSFGDLSLSPTTLTQQFFANARSKPLIGAGRDLTIALRGSAYLSTGDLQAGRDLTITGNNVIDLGSVGTGTAGDKRYAGRNLVVTADPGGDVDLTGGMWYSQGDLRLTGEAILLDRDALVEGAQSGSGAVVLNTRSTQVRIVGGSQLISGTDLSINSLGSFDLEAASRAQATGALSIAASGSIQNSGTVAGNTVLIGSSNGGAFDYINGSTGVLSGTQSVQIGNPTATARSLQVLAPTGDAGIYGGVLNLEAANLTNAGLIQGSGSGSYINVGVLNNNGRIRSYSDPNSGAGGLAVVAQRISNAGMLYDSSNLSVHAGEITNQAAGTFGSAGVLQISTAPVAGASPALFDNQGNIWGDIVQIVTLNGLQNGRDPGLANYVNVPGSIYAATSLQLVAANGSDIINNGTLESGGNMSVVGSGGAFRNVVSGIPAADLAWSVTGTTLTTTTGDFGVLKNNPVGGDNVHTVGTTDFQFGGRTYYFINEAPGLQFAYADTREALAATQTLKPGSALPVQATVKAGSGANGGNLTIAGFQTVQNKSGSLGATGDLNITSTVPGAGVTNESFSLGTGSQLTETTAQYACMYQGAAILCPRATSVQFPGTALGGAVRFEATGTAPSTLMPGTMYAGHSFNTGVPTITNSGVPHTNPGTLPTGPGKTPNNSSSPPVTVTSQGGGTTLTFNGARIPLPTNTGGRFVTGQATGTHPLIETNPLFGIDTTMLGSDYLASKLKLNPDQQVRRLGDDSYEAYLIQQQVQAATGRSMLQGYWSPDDMTQALYDHALSQEKSLSLSYGTALTSGQVASLTSDIVWMVETEVQGQKVVVPVVYLAAATRATVTGTSTISAQDININGGNVVNAGGVIAARDALNINTTGNVENRGGLVTGYDVNIDAGTVKNAGGDITAQNSLNIGTTGNIENLSGKLSAWNVRLTAGGDIVNSTLITRQGDQNTGTDIAQRVASIEAGNTAVLQAANDIKVSGAWVTAGKDAALIAKKNVNIEGLALTTNITGQDGSWSVQGQTALNAGVTAGGNAILRAGQDVNLKGAAVTAGDTADLRAENGNVNVGVLELKHTATSSKTTTGTYTQFDTDKDNSTATLGAGVEHKTTTNTTTITTGVGSGVSGKGVVLSTGKGDVNVTGSSVNAGTDGILVDSARDVNVTAYNNKNEHTSTTDRVRAGVQLDASADGVFGGLAESGDKVTTKTTQTTAQASALNSGGNITIKGKGNVTNEGTQFDATGDVKLSGENVITKAAHDSYTSSTTESKWETKQQEGLTTNGTGESINNAAHGKGNQVSVNNLEWQQRVTGSHSTDTNTNEQSDAYGTQINAGGSIIVNAKNKASDAGTQYTAGKDVSISAESYENKAAANTNTTTDETTYGSGKLTAGLNSAAEVALTASADGGHQKSGTGVSAAVVGNINAGGVVVIKGRSGDVTLEGTQISGDKGVGITAAGDVNINQANNTITNSSSEESGSGRLSASVSLLGTGGSVGAGASTRLANGNDTNSHAKVANIKSSGGDVQLTAGRDLTSQGANVDAAGNVDLKAGRDIKLAAATDRKDTTGSVDSGGVDVNVGFGTDAAENTGSGGATVNFEKGKTDYHEATQHGSTIKAGGSFSVDAGGNARLQGTQVDANTADLKTGGNLVLESAQHTVKDNSYDVGADINASVSKGGGTSGASSVGQGSSGSTGAKGGNAVGGGAQVNVGLSKQDVETNTNATINTRGKTKVDVGGDMSLKGANINADGGVSGKVAGNLTVETRTDKENVDQTNVKAYAGMGPVGGSGGGGKAQRAQEGVQTGANAVGQSGLFTDVNAKKRDNVTLGTGSGISGGKGGIDVRVGGDTTLKGATNSGTDFQTAGKTTIDIVATHNSESDTKLRIAGTAASAAGSDNGKGGDYGLTVHTPGSHGGGGEEGQPKHSGPGANAPEAPAPLRPRTNTNGNEPPAPTHLVPNRNGNEAPAPTHVVPGGNGNGAPAPAHVVPGGNGNEPLAPTHVVPNGNGNEPPAPTHVVPGGSGNEAPAPPRLPALHANEPNAQEPTAPVTRPRGSTESPSDSHAQLTPPHTGAEAPSDLHAQLTPPHTGAEAPSDLHAQLTPPHKAAEPGTEHLALAPTQPGLTHEQIIHRLIEGDPDAQALQTKSSHLSDVDRKLFERNLAEIVAFTKSPNHEADRKQLFDALQLSLDGPQVRKSDSLSVFPLNFHYVGENVQGFDHWFSRGDGMGMPAANSGPDGIVKPPVKYFSQNDRDMERIYLFDGHLTTVKSIVDGRQPQKGNPLTDGQYIFVVNRDGEMIATKPEKGVIHHSSLAAGEPVLMAGEFILKDDKITQITNMSGHFRPSVAAFKEFLVALRAKGVDLDGADATGFELVSTADGTFTDLREIKGLLDHPDVKNGVPKPMLASLTPDPEKVGKLLEHAEAEAQAERDRQHRAWVEANDAQDAADAEAERERIRRANEHSDAQAQHETHPTAPAPQGTAHSNPADLNQQPQAPKPPAPATVPPPLGWLPIQKPSPVNPGVRVAAWRLAA